MCLLGNREAASLVNARVRARATHGDGACTGTRRRPRQKKKKNANRQCDVQTLRGISWRSMFSARQGSTMWTEVEGAYRVVLRTAWGGAGDRETHGAGYARHVPSRGGNTRVYESVSCSVYAYDSCTNGSDLRERLPRKRPTLAGTGAGLWLSTRLARLDGPRYVIRAHGMQALQQPCRRAVTGGLKERQRKARRGPKQSRELRQRSNRANKDTTCALSC